jgi:hypothetical protein
MPEVTVAKVAAAVVVVVEACDGVAEDETLPATLICCCGCW